MQGICNRKEDCEHSPEQNYRTVYYMKKDPYIFSTEIV